MTFIRRAAFNLYAIGLLFLSVMLFALRTNAQTVIYAEDFNAVFCTSGCPANGYNGWTVTNVTPNGAASNQWYVSCAENGMQPGQCGSACAGNNTLHIGKPTGSSGCTFGDCGATYVSGTGGATDKRVESPTIDLSGACDMQIKFHYIENGELLEDNLTVEYFDGVEWNAIAIAGDPAKTDTCAPNGFGLWGEWILALPAPANGNPNVKIGFRWKNNDDGQGTDPSVAIDNVQIVGTPAPAAFFSLNGFNICLGDSITAAIPAQEPNVNYTWFVNGDLFHQGFEFPAHIPSNVGPVVITLWAGNACDTSVSEETVSVNGGHSVTASGENPECNLPSGSIDANVTGGATPYAFSWSNAFTTEDLENLSPGNYSVTVTDADGCAAETSVTLINVNTFTTETITAVNAVCNEPNGAVDLSVSGGTSPYTFEWSNGETTEDLTNVAPGNYEVTITQANGCSSTQSPVVEAVPPPSVSVVVEHSYCGEDGTAQAAVLNGTSPNEYIWNNGETSATVTGDSGIYATTVTDANGCTASHSATINAFPAPTLFAAANPAFCGNANGSANLFIATSSPVTNIAWSTGSSFEDLDGVASGSYTVTVTDANACAAELTVAIGDTASVLTQLTVDMTSASCGTENGMLDANAAGTDPLQYMWSTGATTANATDLAPGDYVLSITDFHGCTFTDTFTVDEIVATAEADIVGPDTTVIDSVNAFAIALQPGSTIEWNVGNGLMNGQGTNAISVVWTTVGTQTVTVLVTDAGGCVAYDTITVYVDDATGMDRIKQANAHWTLFPNPANESITIRIEGEDVTSYRLEIFSIEGKVLTEKTLNATGKSSEHTVSLEDFVPGVYFFRLTSGASSNGKHFTIVR